MKSFFGSRKAFTLIELLVIILIVAIMLSFIVPVFLGKKEKAFNSKTQQYLTYVLKDVKSIWLEKEKFVRYQPASNLNGYGVSDGSFENKTLLGALKETNPNLNFIAYNNTANINAQADTLSVSLDPENDNNVIVCQAGYNNSVLCFAFSGNSSLQGKETIRSKASNEKAARCVFDHLQDYQQICTTNEYDNAKVVKSWDVTLDGQPLPQTTTPKNETPPSITGNFIIGQTLTVNTGEWSSDQGTTTEITWQKCKNNTCVDIPAANDQNYIISPSDKDYKIKVRVTKYNSTQSATAYSPESSTIN